MDDPISRQAAIDAINHICPVDTEYDCTLLDLVDVRCVLSDLPPAEPERKQGKWIYPYESTKMICFCSICGHGTGTGFNPYKFCPHCGAEMKGDKK